MFILQAEVFILQGIDLRPAKSTTEFKEILKKYAEKNKGKWITGGNWDHEAWEVKDIPTKEMIDEFTQENSSVSLTDSTVIWHWQTRMHLSWQRLQKILRVQKAD